MESVLNDKRFAHVAKDPRFHRMPKGDRKVKIDKRFKDMFEDKRFKLKYTVDSRGRPVNQTTNENLKKFYELSDSEDSDDSGAESDDEKEDAEKSDSEDSSEEESGVVSVSSRTVSQEESDSDSESSDDEVVLKPTKHDKKKSTIKLEKKKKKNENKLTKVKEKSTEVDKSVSDKTKAAKKKKKQDAVEENNENTNSVGKGKVKKQKQLDTTTDETKKKQVKTKEAKGKKKKDLMTDTMLDKEIDYARGEGYLSSSSDDDSDDSDASAESSDFDHKWNEQDDNIAEVPEASRRLAVCNMDWDRIKARDIFFLLSSFKPAQGLVKSVKVYPSEFGKERMEQERLEGPKELKELKQAKAEMKKAEKKRVAKKKASGKDDEEEEELDKDGTRFQTEKLRQYQLLRLKYYYAVVECDSVDTADHVYRECDGKEYETSSTKVDLRFIPDDMEFEDEPTSSCTDIPVDYKPNLFFNTALSQSKVDLTWDETDRERTHKIARQFDPTGEDLEEDDLNAYLAASSDEEAPVDYGSLVQQSDSDSDSGDDKEPAEAKEEKQISKYKMLLQELDQQEKEKDDRDVQMEITWEPGLKETTEEIVKKKKEVKPVTPWEDYLEKKKQKKKQKQLDKQHQRLLQQTATGPGDEEEEEEEEQAFSDDDLPAGVDLDDSFFDDESTAKAKSKNDDKKKKKKKKKDIKETEEDKKEKEALSLLMLGEDEGKKHFNLKRLMEQDKKKKKNKKNRDKQGETAAVKEEDFQMNVQDPRFSAMYESHLFNIDPSAPEFKKTKGTEAIVSEKLKRSKKKGNKNPNTDSSGAKKRKLEEGAGAKDESIATLVNSIKMKTKNFKGSKSKR